MNLNDRQELITIISCLKSIKLRAKDAAGELPPCYIKGVGQSIDRVVNAISKFEKNIDEEISILEELIKEAQA